MGVPMLACKPLGNKTYDVFLFLVLARKSLVDTIILGNVYVVVRPRLILTADL